MKVICFGDSNTYGYDPRSLFGEPYDVKDRWVDIFAEKTGWNVINEGVNGREIPDKPVSFPEDADFLVVMLGTNDILQFWTPEDAAGKMEHFLKGLSISPDKILLIAPPPMQMGAWVEDQELIDDSIALARQYRELASRTGVYYADAGEWKVGLGHDGVHFTAEGHRAFALGLCQVFKEITA